MTSNQAFSPGAAAQFGVNMDGANSTWGTFPTLADLENVKSEGVNLVRLPIAWEMMQPTLNGPLSASYLSGLETFLNQAASLNMQVVVDVHNSGRYNINFWQDAAANYGIQAPDGPDASVLGSAAVPISAFANFWQQLATALNGNSAVAGYDLMNEPHDMGNLVVWPEAAQAAVDAIRTVDMHTPIIVEGNNWANAENWVQDNANLHITDPANAIVYEAHVYFDSNNSGNYAQTYAQQGATPDSGVQAIEPFLQWLQANNYKGYVGEFGVPSNDPQWIPVLNNFLNALQAAGVSGTEWNYINPHPTDPDWWVSSLTNTNNTSGEGGLNVAPLNGEIVSPQMALLFEHSSPTITSSSPGAASGVFILSGSAAANSTVNIFDGNNLLATTTANSVGAWSLTTRALANGTHSFTATDMDAVGDVSEVSASFSVTLNTQAPNAPAITSFSTDSGVVGDHITNDNTLTLTGTAEANSTVKIFDGATLLGTATAAANGTWSFATAALTNGAHSFTATDTDAAGNTSTASAALSVTIDTTAPIAPAIASFSTDSGVVGDHITNDNTLTLTGTAEANSTVKIFDGATLLGTATAAANGTWSFATAALTNGAHSFTATDTDTAGNTSAASAALVVIIDTVAPGAPVIVSDAVVNTNEVLLTGTAETNSTVNVFDGTTKIGTTVAGTNGMWSFTTTALTNGAHSFTATDTDTAGNTSLVSQPLDPVIGAIESNGLTSLTQVGNEYFLYNSAGSGPALKAGGAPVVAGQFVGWTPLGAEQTANGYQVVWKMAGADQYSIFNADSNGNYLSNTICAGTSFLLESIETSLQQDLNGDGHIGLVSTTIESNGLTSLTQVGNEYFLYNSAGSGPALKAGGAPVVVGQFVGWTPLGAEQTANGYQVVWKMAGADQYSIFNADSNGNYLSNTICAGTSFLLESIETSLQQDLNGDGHIGLVSTTIESNGLTSLTQVGNEYFLYNSAGSGPALKAGGAPVVVGQFVGWTPLGAEQTANGYQVVWKMAGADQYSIFNADSNGNYLSNTICAGTSFLLESIETSLQQDLNGDGHIGLVSTTIESNGLTSLTQVGNEYFLYNSAGSGPALKAGGAPVVVGQFVGWTPLGAEQTANGYQVVWKMAGADQYSIFNADSNGNYLSNTICAGTSFLLESIETSLQQDLNGDGHIGLVINAGATLELSGAESGAVTFSGSTGVLKLDNPASFHGSIAGFAGDGTLLGSDQIDLSNMTYNSSIQSNSTYNGSTGVLEVNNGTNIDFFQFVGNYSLANFKFASDGHGGTTVYDPPTTGLENVGFNSGAASGAVHNYVVSAVDGPSSSSSVTPSGAASSDVIKLGATNNLVTGNAGNDTFVFNSNIGKNDGIDTQGVDAQHDVAHFISNAFNDFANVLSHAAQAEPDLLGTGHAIDMAAVKSVQHSDLQQNNIHIV